MTPEYQAALALIDRVTAAADLAAKPREAVGATPRETTIPAKAR